MSNSTHFFQLRELDLDKIVSKEIQVAPITPTTIGEGEEEREDGYRERERERDVERGGEEEGDGETDYGTKRTVSTESMV